MPSGYPHAFLYSDGVMRDLGSPDGGVYPSDGYAINDAGVVVGSTFDSEISAAYYVYSAFAYANGQMRVTGNGIAYAISADGVVAGTTTPRLQPSHPFIDVDGARLSIPALDGAQGAALAVNARGEVTGGLDRGAFVYAAGGVTIIEGLDTGLGINSSGAVVGVSPPQGAGRTRASLFAGGVVYDLNALVFAGLGGMTLLDATAINDAGQIVANGCDPGGDHCMAFRLDPAPRPETAEAIEYYNASLDHYFITHRDNEIALLDAGVAIRGWARTGQSFTVGVVPRPEMSPVCRFYLPPGSGDSHFYGRGADECARTAASHPEFVEEDAQFFFVTLPLQGVCRLGERPVYRVFDNRADANHRYMVDRSIRDRMVEEGWVAEGDGPDRVVMCVPG